MCLNWLNWEFICWVDFGGGEQVSQSSQINFKTILVRKVAGFFQQVFLISLELVNWDLIEFVIENGEIFIRTLTLNLEGNY